MPRQGYNLLSERQREYLEDPDGFVDKHGAGRAADVRYAIRERYDAVRDDLDLLEEMIFEWDTYRTEYRTVVECRGCGGLDSDYAAGEWQPVPEIVTDRGGRERDEPEGWVIPPRSLVGEAVSSDHYPDVDWDECLVNLLRGWCPDCRPDDDVVDRAVESGLIPCWKDRDGHPDRHEIGGDAAAECIRHRNVPLTNDELDAVRAANK